MEVLLDTHVWLWAVEAPDRLNDRARKLIANPENVLWFSAASAWEIAIKCSIGKLKLPEAPGAFVRNQQEGQGISPLPIVQAHALEVAVLPRLHKDPFDRLLVAQAKLEDLPILTADRKLLGYGVEIIWAGLQPKPAASPRAAGRRRRRRSARG